MLALSARAQWKKHRPELILARSDGVGSAEGVPAAPLPPLAAALAADAC